ncbi:hypothetical protein GCM10011380_02390 [Sphingomonas metalli]|uniref:Tetratricopeptide repeat protein n=1 Tax=Sphingomonas metalli TaxID=1779358 RepID=A0A916SU50_9SPHN|nr:tetratricopeptide repeat protein [Sphingomonas metalli]GGB16428.1 hypothetical protein GCM10011380_02390 [Sphingomonas metalli]
MRRMMVAVAAVAMAMPAAGFAQGDRTGYQAIAQGDLSQAEATLTAERRIYPRRPELMLNLAAVYGRTGRADAARQLYRAVLDQPDVAMLMPSGASVSAHAIAQHALTLSPDRLATR